jgi:hypothetical protein
MLVLAVPAIAQEAAAGAGDTLATQPWWAYALTVVLAWLGRVGLKFWEKHLEKRSAAFAAEEQRLKEEGKTLSLNRRMLRVEMTAEAAALERARELAAMAGKAMEDHVFSKAELEEIKIHAKDSVSEILKAGASQAWTDAKDAMHMDGDGVLEDLAGKLGLKVLDKVRGSLGK